MTASATDYAWVRGSLLDSHLGYGVGLVKEICREEVLGRLQAHHQGTCTGLTALYRRNADVQERLNYEYGDFQLVGTAAVTGTDGEWTLMVEFNVAVGFNHRLMARVSTGTQAVTHHLDPVGKGGFNWWQDGRLLTSFEWPHDRRGEDPDALNEVIDRVGVGSAEGHKVEEYFALAEEVTGVRLTSGLLERAVFSAGIVAVTEHACEQGWSWTGREPTPDELAARDSDIRAWAKSREIKLIDRGRNPVTIVEVYDASHPARPRERGNPWEG